jgi:hypothetical protein
MAATTMRGIDVAVERLDVSVTAAGDATAIVLVEAQAGDRVASRLPERLSAKRVQF